MAIVSISSASEALPIDRATLDRVMMLYGLDEKGATERLAAEAQAAVADFHIRNSDLAGYAGSWFDADTLRLQVASKASKDADLIRALDADPIAVEWSLEELEAIRERVAGRLAEGVADDGGLISSRVDYPLNQVVFTVTPSALSASRTLVANETAVKVESSRDRPSFSSGPVRGGNGTRNQTWFTHYPAPPENPNQGKCSIGVAVNQGFLTAGHCTFGNNPDHGHEDIRTPAFVSLGLAQNSTMTFNGFLYQRDAAWVQTQSGWTPVPEINNYSGGTLIVPAEWSGYLEAPVNATVCRYGEASGGPYCGTVAAKNVTVCFGDVGFCFNIGGLTEVSGSCTNDGDSGGPHVAASNQQVQGINIGGGPTNNCFTSYPSSGDKVFFQPVTQGLGLMNRTMLTTHGTAVPTVQGLFCESLGWSTFFCGFSTYRSQGTTTWSWSSNQGHLGTGSFVNGGCIEDTWPVVSLTLTNPYGSNVVNTTFRCRGGPPL